MSDYFLNKIYDSLLSNKPVPKKSEPITKKKEETKTLQESYQLMYKKSNQKEWSGPVIVPNSFFSSVINPALDRAKFSIPLRIFLNRAKSSGVVDKGADVSYSGVQYLFDYAAKSTDINRVVEVFESSQKLQEVGNKFLSALASSQKFNYLGYLNSIYGGDFKYDSYIIDEMKPYMGKATRGAPGPGEVFFAFFFNGIKPQVGDLEINNTLCEIKKQKGRIGKSIDRDQGVALKKIYSGKKPVGGDVAPDSNIINAIITEYNLETIRDLILGKDRWEGITGLKDVSRFNCDYFNQPLGKVQLKGRVELMQIIGAMQLADYIKKVKPFKYMFVFKENGECLGFESSIITDNPEQTSKMLNSKGIFFEPKSGGGSFYDDSGMQILLK